MEKGDRIFKIFISSTFEDLQDQRKQAIEVIFERGHIPIALERFSPANENDLEVIRSAIADCQIYITILGHRYGEIVPGHGISFTELEFNIAEENGLLILVFVLNRQEMMNRRELLNEKIEKEKREKYNFPQYERFFENIKHFKKFWGHNDQFKFLVATAIDDNLHKCNKPGFVREPEDSMKNLLASVSQNEFILDTIERVKSFKKLYDRLLEHREQKKEIARFFAEAYLDRIICHKASLFFESGSTVAYVAREISSTLSKVVKIKGKGRPNLQISTNNILAYLQLWLIGTIPCTTFPWSPPGEETYGALYGGLERIQPKRPDYSMPKLDQEAKEEIKKLLEAPYTISSMKTPTLILAAASGLQIGKGHKMKFHEGIEESQREALMQQVDKCFGPHIGSYHNKIFKRFLYETSVPIMFFLTENKIDCEIIVGETHFVLDLKQA